MSKEQEDYVDSINQSPDNEIFIKETGREIVDLPQHWHTKHQIIHTLSGTLRIQVEDKVYFVPENHIALIPKNIVHKLSSNNRQISLQMIYCDLLSSSKDIFSVYNTNTFILVNLKFIARNPGVIRRSEQPKLYDYCISFLNLFPATGERYKTPLRALVIPDDIRLQAILKYINEHLDEELGMERVASQFGFSVRNLSRLFRKSGIRFTDYVNYQRITRAIEMFADRDKTIQEIAYETGFSTPGNFNRVFKQITGTNPSTFCKKK
ncbi:MAG: AraC family transcriptional regulator [Muribaculaceae bacterium]|nr:AraC family transcriptional regulator [Muribaculaceae bacterium]